MGGVRDATLEAIHGYVGGFQVTGRFFNNTMVVSTKCFNCLEKPTVSILFHCCTEVVINKSWMQLGLERGRLSLKRGRRTGEQRSQMVLTFDDLENRFHNGELVFAESSWPV